VFRRILVPLDGSELAERALPYATDLARQLGATLTLLRVVNSLELTAAQSFSSYLPAEVYDAAFEDARRAAREYLEVVASRLSAEGLQVDWVVRTGDPAGEVIEHGREGHADLVVMSTHGRSGLGRWVYGSVADRVLRGGTIPVLLVRAFGSAGHTEHTTTSSPLPLGEG
jgi:nucleotide-binding universal stress UspA family protein